MGNQYSSDEETAQKPVFVIKSDDIYDVEDCPKELDDIDIVVENPHLSKKSAQSREKWLESLNKQLTINNSNYDSLDTVEMILEEFRDWPWSREHYNDEVIILCRLAQIIIGKSNVLTSEDQHYHMLTELIDEIIMRTVYVRQSGANQIGTLFTMLIKKNLKEHANLVLDDLYELPNKANPNEKSFTYCETLLPDMAKELLKLSKQISGLVRVEGLVMKYVDSVDWETTENTDNFTHIGELISIAHGMENKDLYKSLIDIVEYDISYVRKSADILDAYFRISKTLDPAQLEEIPIFEFIETHMANPDNYTQYCVDIFLTYLKQYVDDFVVVYNKKLFYPLLRRFINSYLPRLSKNTYPNLSNILYSTRIMCDESFVDKEFIYKAIMQIIGNSAAHIDKEEFQTQIYWMASNDQHIRVLKTMYDADMYNAQVFEKTVYYLVERKYSLSSNDIEFVKQCIRAMMYQTKDTIVVDYKPENSHPYLARILLMIVDRKEYGTFRETAFMYLNDYWMSLVPSGVINTYLLIMINELLVDQQSVIKYAPLIQRANEYMDLINAKN